MLLHQQHSVKRFVDMQMRSPKRPMKISWCTGSHLSINTSSLSSPTNLLRKKYVNYSYAPSVIVNTENVLTCLILFIIKEI